MQRFSLKTELIEIFDMMRLMYSEDRESFSKAQFIEKIKHYI